VLAGGSTCDGTLVVGSRLRFELSETSKWDFCNRECGLAFFTAELNSVLERDAELRRDPPLESYEALMRNAY